MKFITALSMALAVSISSIAFAQSYSMKSMSTKDTTIQDIDMQKCMSMKGMEMKKVDA